MRLRTTQTRSVAPWASFVVAAAGCPGDAPTLPSVTSGAATETTTTADDTSDGDDGGSTGPGGSSGGTDSVDDTAGPSGLGSITGRVVIVNANTSTGTTVAIVPADAYVPNVHPTEVIATAPDITGMFTFENVPAGPVYVFGSLADDGLVVDPAPGPDRPDPGPILVDVVGGDTYDVGTIQIVGAMTLLDPARPGVTRVPPGEATVELTWVDEPAADSYQIRVFDSLGLPSLNVVIPSPETPQVLQSLSIADYAPGEYQVRVAALTDMVPITVTDESLGRFAVP